VSVFTDNTLVTVRESGCCEGGIVGRDRVVVRCQNVPQVCVCCSSYRFRVAEMPVRFEQ
jgi:hypothetical protein